MSQYAITVRDETGATETVRVYAQMRFPARKADRYLPRHLRGLDVLDVEAV